MLFTLIGSITLWRAIQMVDLQEKVFQEHIHVDYFDYDQQYGNSRDEELVFSFGMYPENNEDYGTLSAYF